MPMVLSEYLKVLRLGSGMSRAQWAARSGVTRMTLWRWEQGKSVPHARDLQLALSALTVGAAQRERALRLREEAQEARRRGGFAAFHRRLYRPVDSGQHG